MQTKLLLTIQAYGMLVLSTAALAEGSTTNTAENNSTDSNSQVVELPSLKVTARSLSDYQADESSVGTRTNTPFDETPQSVQVITQELIEDQAANEVTDLFRSMSGVSYLNYGIVKMRGFEQESQVLYDGIKGDPFRTFTIPQLFNIEEVQTLKGPSGALYGAGEAGGVINYVTKKPSYEQENNIKLTAGNQDYYGRSLHRLNICLHGSVAKHPHSLAQKILYCHLKNLDCLR